MLLLVSSRCWRAEWVVVKWQHAYSMGCAVGLLTTNLDVLCAPYCLQATKGNRSISFYTLPEYEEWREANNTRGWTTKYYKASQGARLCVVYVCNIGGSRHRR